MSTTPDDALDDGDREPPSVGTARMDKDGTLKLYLRTETAEGMVGEMLMVVPRDDKRYPDMVRHLSGIQPGEAREIPPFPAPEIDPKSI
jgi:hypothetical protein